MIGRSVRFVRSASSSKAARAGRDAKRQRLTGVVDLQATDDAEMAELADVVPVVEEEYLLDRMPPGEFAPITGREHGERKYLRMERDREHADKVCIGRGRLSVKI